ncbi:TniB family NTP-binding protein [Rhizobium leguminosarum]|uniref:TniB family NTP-binding protein n=2 Tax=Rhizobium TaxID=379 RepID=UPI001F48E59C|nr:TniB family NTP-binding protein [Rhizobium leguminosarum]UIJ81745.1 TniB family NTP-binding protein [Rhizobium leguminosarum]
MTASDVTISNEGTSMTTSSLHDDYFSEAAKAIYDSLDPDRQARVETLGRMHTRYVGTPRDPLLDELFDSIVENVAAALFGKAAKRRAIFVVGESGSGKTTAVERHIAKRPQFAPRVASDGKEVRPLVAFEAPKPLTLKGLARAGLAALNFDVAYKQVTEQEIFDLWKEQLKEQQVLFLWIDEMQHVLRGNTTKEIQNVADVLKSLVQIDGWPLHLILSGVPALAQFVHIAGDADGQLKGRSNLVELRALNYPDDLKLVRKVLLKIVIDHAKLEASPDLESDDFVHQVMHASSGGLGLIIQLIRAACEHALRRKSSFVEKSDFEFAYGLSGCRESQNIFKTTAWKSIDPNNALGETLARVFKLEAEKADAMKAAKKEVK